MSDVESAVRRSVIGIDRFARAMSRWATRILAVTVVVCGGGFLLGLAALDGGIETVWAVLATVFGAIAIGAAIIARWRVGAVRRHLPELAAEVRSLVTAGDSSAQAVIETFAIDPDDTSAAGRGDGAPGDGSAIVWSRRVYGMRGVATDGFGRATRLGAAVAALTTLPLLVLLAIAISIVFTGCALVFLLALAL